MVDLSKLLDKIFLILPNYCLGQSISKFYQNYEFMQFCTSSFEATMICKVFSEYRAPPCTSASEQAHSQDFFPGGGAFRVLRWLRLKKLKLIQLTLISWERAVRAISRGGTCLKSPPVATGLLLR